MSANLRLYLVCALWCLVVAAPALVREDVDDAFFLEVAELWARGEPPFLFAFDVKGTGAYALFAVAVHLFGASLAVVKLCGAGCVALATAALYRLAARYDRTAAVVCAFVFPVLMQILGDPVYQVMNAALVLGAARLLPDEAASRDVAIGGLWLGFAFVVKQTCLADVVFWGAVLGMRGGPKAGGRLLALAAGALAAPALAAAYFWDVGGLSVALKDLFAIAARRTERREFAGLESLLFSHDLVLAGLLIPAALALRPALRGLLTAPVAILAAWLACEQIDDVLQGGIWWTYATPSVAPALMLAAVCVGAMARAARADERTAAALLSLAVLVVPLSTRGLVAYAYLPAPDSVLTQDALATVRAASPDPADRLLSLNGSAMPNVVTGLAPPTPVFHFEQIMCPFPGAGLPALRANFDARPRFVVLEHVGKRLDCETNETADFVTQALRDYDLLRAGRSPAEAYEIYQRKR